MSSHLEIQFAMLWEATYPEIDLYSEYRFAAPRRFKADFCCPIAKVIIEIQGGIWADGRHSRGSGLYSEYEKLCIAASLGYLVFLLSEEMIDDRYLCLIATAIRERLPVCPLPALV